MTTDLGRPKTVKLDKLGHLRSGYNSRSTLDLKTWEEHRYLGIQLSAQMQDGQMDWSKAYPIHFEGNPKRYLIHDDDVLFPLRGSRTIAVVIRDSPKNTLAIGNWVILTPDVSKVKSAYVAWYWNHPYIARRRENDLIKGSRTQFMSMRDCRDFKVQLTTLERQQQIIKIDELRQRERELSEKIEHLKDELVNAATMRLVTGKLV